MKHYLIKNTLLRGVLCLLLCVVGLASAWGEEVTVTFNASTNELNWRVGGAQTGTKDGITISTTAGAYNTNNKDYRIYKSETLTIACDNANITKVTITCSESETNEYGPGNFTNPTSGTYSYSQKTGTWTGSAQTITLTASKSQVRMKKIVVTYENITPPPAINTLSITDLYSETKREYYIGETPSAEGLAVTATYEDNSTGDITYLVSWSFEPTTILSNTTSVTATASYEEKSAQYTYNIANKGEKTFHNYTLDLSTDSYSSASTKTVKWDAVVASMTLSKGEGKDANHYLGGSENKETSFYTGHKINITPKATIHHIIFTTTDDTFTRNLLVSTYTNAIASQDGNSNNIVITPTNGDNDISITMAGQCKCTSMTIYYLPIVSTLTDAGYATFCLPYNATVPEGLTAYTATDNGEFVKLTAKEGNKIAAGEGVVLKGNEGTYTFVATEGSVTPTAGNQMVGVTKDTVLTEADNAYMLTRKKDDNSIAFRLLKTNYTLGANKAYLKVDGSANTHELIPALWDDNATGIENTAGSNITNIIYNLAGQKLMHIQKGVNIINGKLIVK